MTSIDVYLKVEVDLDEGEAQDKIQQELVKALEKVFGVRRAEVTNVITHSGD
jgi:hypothetical protein